MPRNIREVELASLFSTLLNRPRKTADASRLARKSDAATVPDGLLVYAIGDIHGRRDLLEKMIGQIAGDVKRHADLTSPPMVFFLGDYIDRGSDSKGVIELLANELPAEWTCRFLKGNHEEAALQFIVDPRFGDTWRDFGGIETLRSYGVVPRREGTKIDWASAARDFEQALPNAHRRFFDSLSKMEVVGDYVFVHAGIRPGLPLDLQSEQDLLWIRNEFLIDVRASDKTVVHGHTPGEKVQFGPGRIGIDTGAYLTGRLSALCLRNSDRWFLST
jgi:serine/threonine protein phosphatase 1